MKARQNNQAALLAREFKRLQREFRRQNPEVAEAMKVMDISMAEYLTASGYLREPAQVSSSDESILTA